MFRTTERKSPNFRKYKSVVKWKIHGQKLMELIRSTVSNQLERYNTEMQISANKTFIKTVVFFSGICCRMTIQISGKIHISCKGRPCLCLLGKFFHTHMTSITNYIRHCSFMHVALYSLLIIFLF